MTDKTAAKITKAVIQDTRRKRIKAEDIILAALRRAISEGLDKKSLAMWGGSKQEYVENLLEDWLSDEDGRIAVDRLVNLIIY